MTPDTTPSPPPTPATPPTPPSGPADSSSPPRPSTTSGTCPANAPDPDNYWASYGLRVRDARTNAGWTQTELADRLGLGRASVANIEAGRQHPPVTEVLAAATTLQVDPQWLLLGDDHTTWPYSVAPSVLNRTRRTLHHQAATLAAVLERTAADLRVFLTEVSRP